MRWLQYIMKKPWGPPTPSGHAVQARHCTAKPHPRSQPSGCLFLASPMPALDRCLFMPIISTWSQPVPWITAKPSPLNARDVLQLLLTQQPIATLPGVALRRLVPVSLLSSLSTHDTPEVRRALKWPATRLALQAMLTGLDMLTPESPILCLDHLPVH